MSPITHFLTGWMIASTDHLAARDRMLVTVAAVVPDADALGIIAEKITEHSGHPLMWWSEYHHVLCHNIGFCMAVMIAAGAAAKRKYLTPMLVCLSFHLHLLGDIIGAKGPDGYQWPIPYLLPFSEKIQWVWKGQWAINAWPNMVLTAVLLGISFYLAWKRGYSPLEMISQRADQVFVQTLRNRFGKTKQTL